MSITEEITFNIQRKAFTNKQIHSQKTKQQRQNHKKARKPQKLTKQKGPAFSE